MRGAGREINSSRDLQGQRKSLELLKAPVLAWADNSSFIAVAFIPQCPTRKKKNDIISGLSVHN
jgi:hypothetical protein